MYYFKSLLSLIFFAALLTGCGKSQIDHTCEIYSDDATGNCSFTNTGDDSDYTCGIIEVTCSSFDNYKEQSKPFCSGDIKPSSTNKVNFSVPGIIDLCPDGLIKCGCVFEWEENM